MANKDDVLKFSTDIEKYVATHGSTYIDAVITHSQEIGLELEVAATLLSPSIRAKVENEAVGLNLLKDKVARLPF